MRLADQRTIWPSLRLSSRRSSKDSAPRAWRGAAIVERDGPGLWIDGGDLRLHQFGASSTAQPAKIDVALLPIVMAGNLDVGMSPTGQHQVLHSAPGADDRCAPSRSLADLRSRYPRLPYGDHVASHVATLPRAFRIWTVADGVGPKPWWSPLLHLASRRSGPASTWQCRHVMLQTRPRLICRVEMRTGVSGHSPCCSSSVLNSWSSDTPSLCASCTLGCASGRRRDASDVAGMVYIPTLVACPRIWTP